MTTPREAFVISTAVLDARRRNNPARNGRRIMTEMIEPRIPPQVEDHVVADARVPRT